MVQVDYTVMSADGEACTKPKAQGATLMGIGVDNGKVATTALHNKTDEHSVRFARPF